MFIYMDDDYVYSKINNYTRDLILKSNLLAPNEREKLLRMGQDDNYAILKLKFKK